MVYSQDAELGHSFAAPFEWVLGGRDIPVVPVFVNTYLPPLPSPRRCASFGAKIAEIIGSRPERVAMLASGGMSHYPGTWKYYQPAFGFDRWCIQQLEWGYTNSFLDLTVEQLDEVGNTEMLPWAPVLGALGDQHMELLSYQETAHHGHAVARFHPGLPENPGEKLSYRFGNHPFSFYAHPSVESYKLNKLLYESRFKTSVRIKLLVDPRGVAEDYELGPEETETLIEVARLPHRKSAQPARDAEPLVNLGAHPLGALMAVHVWQAEQRRLDLAAA
jgi:2,3-dihydroxyphenylpropionate 1,2-dioxygenase